MSRSKCDSWQRVKTLEAEVAKLRRQVEDLARAGRRQAAPFSKGKPKPDPKRPGRKSGKACGRRAFRRRGGRAWDTHERVPHGPSAGARPGEAFGEAPALAAAS